MCLALPPISRGLCRGAFDDAIRRLFGISIADGILLVVAVAGQ
jgi:hypothetical protein